MAYEELNFIVTQDLKGKRLDQVLAILCPQHSRSRLQAWIRLGFILVNNKTPRQRDILDGGENIKIIAESASPESAPIPESLPLNIIYNDDDIVVVDKPDGLVVHPGAGNQKHTLLNALLYHVPNLEMVPRAGIVQRLDKDTSGLMVIARTPTSHTQLVRQLQKREIKREYQAIISGVPTTGGTVTAPIGRHPLKRKRMAVVETGKSATTHFQIIQKFQAHTHVRVQLESGRTHQIRVHMAYKKHPIVGDPVYGGRQRLPKNSTESLRTSLQSFPRQALHASKLEFMHPIKQSPMIFESILPDDIKGLLKSLAEND